MATFGAAVSQILADIKRTDTSITAEVESHVLQAVEHYSTRRFWFNEFRGSFTASSTIYYPVATAGGGALADLREIDRMTVTISGTRYPVVRDTFQNLEDLDMGSTITGYPERYAVFQEQIRLYPTPNGVYQVDVMGQARLATLSASTNSNALLTHGLDLILARAEKTLWARKVKDPGQAQVCAQLEDEALHRLDAQTVKFTSSGRLSPG